MTNEQLYLAIGLPALFNAVLISLLAAYIHARFDAIDAKFRAVDSRFDAINRRFDDVNRRFDDMPSCTEWKK